MDFNENDNKKDKTKKRLIYLVILLLLSNFLLLFLYINKSTTTVKIEQQLVSTTDLEELSETEPGVVKLWCKRDQMALLCEQALEVVNSGRADPKQNGRLVYYWS